MKNNIAVGKIKPEIKALNQNNFSRTLYITAEDLSNYQDFETLEEQICAYINDLGYLKTAEDADIWIEYGSTVLIPTVRIPMGTILNIQPLTEDMDLYMNYEFIEQVESRVYDYNVEPPTTPQIMINIQKPTDTTPFTAEFTHYSSPVNLWNTANEFFSGVGVENVFPVGTQVWFSDGKEEFDPTNVMTVPNTLANGNEKVGTILLFEDLTEYGDTITVELNPEVLLRDLSCGAYNGVVLMVKRAGENDFIEFYYSSIYPVFNVTWTELETGDTIKLVDTIGDLLDSDEFVITTSSNGSGGGQARQQYELSVGMASSSAAYPLDVFPTTVYTTLADSIIVPGSKVYTNIELSATFSGNNLWYKVATALAPTGAALVQIDNSGTVLTSNIF
jgi:hypothetical protein